MQIEADFREHPFERLAVYSSSTNDGGVKIDIRAMVWDLIAVTKFNGFDLMTLLGAISDEWPNVEAMVTISDRSKN